MMYMPVFFKICYIMGGWVRQHLLGHDPLFMFSREAVKHDTTLKFTSLSIELDSHACRGAGRAYVAVNQEQSLSLPPLLASDFVACLPFFFV